MEAHSQDTEEERSCESKFLTLASELIEYIFNIDVLSHIDVCHLSRTCRRFNAIASSKEVWRAKANQRWSSWKHKPHAESDWGDIFRRRFKCNREIMQHINYIIDKSFKKDCLENGDLKVFGEYCDNKDDEDMKQIENIFHGIISNDRFKMLTLKFYSRKIYIYINQHRLTKKWCTFLCKPDESQYLIQGSLLIAEWCSQLRDVCEGFVHKQIDEIASKVKEKVATLEKQPQSQAETVTKAYKILEAMQIVLFQDIGFHGNRQSYYDVNNSFIDKVLELRAGIPITLSIVVAAVAEKLGIHLEPVNFPMHFLLRYSPSNSSDKCKYIDAFHGGKIMDELDCIQILPFESRNTVPRHALFPTASPRQVFIRMVANVINTYRSSTIVDGRSIDNLRSALELMMLLCPDDEEHRLMLSRVYLHLGVNLDEVMDNLRQLLTSTRGTMQMGLLTSLLEYAVKKQSEEAATNASPRYRSDEMNSEVSYYIGMVMHHKRYHYFCVIYGWDNFCNMEENWRIQMGVYNLTDGADQPFYNVLADDGSCRYASQENLVPLNAVKSCGRPIFHQDIGKYFDEFNGLHYVPNYLLMRSYPEDAEIPRDLLPAVPYEKLNEIEPLDEG